MKVKKIMTSEVGTCRPNQTLSDAVGIMWQMDCGVVPVVSEENKVFGMVTDRDISIAVTTRNRTSSEVLIGEVIRGQAICCSADDSVRKALKKMCRHQIRRLPVIDKKGGLIGVISIADVFNAKCDKAVKKQLLKTMESISKRPSILLKEI